MGQPQVVIRGESLAVEVSDCNGVDIDLSVIEGTSEIVLREVR